MFLLLTLEHYKEVDAKQWAELKKNGDTFVTLFFAPWCGHCKAFGPEYSRAGKKLAGVLDFVSVDCTAQSNQQLCGQQQVQGYPTIKIFNSVKGKKGEPYEGQRTADDVSKWAMGLQKKPFTEVKGLDSNVKDKLANLTDKNVVIITTNAKKASSLAFKIAHKLSKKAVVICHVGFDEEANKSYADTVFEGKITVFDKPTIVVKIGEQFKAYDGENSGEAIEAWIAEIFA